MDGDLQECFAAEQCASDLYYQDALDVIMECLTDNPCNLPDDSCYTEAANAFPLTPAQQSFSDACLAAYAICPDAGQELCELAGIWGDGVAAQYETCTALPCAEIKDCYDDVFAMVLAPCGGAQVP